jgi:hypothetical protein
VTFLVDVSVAVEGVDTGNGAYVNFPLTEQTEGRFQYYFHERGYRINTGRFLLQQNINIDIRIIPCINRNRNNTTVTTWSPTIVIFNCQFNHSMFSSLQHARNSLKIVNIVSFLVVTVWIQLQLLVPSYDAYYVWIPLPHRHSMSIGRPTASCHHAPTNHGTIDIILSKCRIVSVLRQQQRRRTGIIHTYRAATPPGGSNDSGEKKKRRRKNPPIVPIQDSSQVVSTQPVVVEGKNDRMVVKESDNDRETIQPPPPLTTTRADRTTIMADLARLEFPNDKDNNSNNNNNNYNPSSEEPSSTTLSGAIALPDIKEARKRKQMEEELARVELEKEEQKVRIKRTDKEAFRRVSWMM